MNNRGSAYIEPLNDKEIRRLLRPRKNQPVADNGKKPLYRKYPRCRESDRIERKGLSIYQRLPAVERQKALDEALNDLKKRIPAREKFINKLEQLAARHVDDKADTDTEDSGDDEWEEGMMKIRRRIDVEALEYLKRTAVVPRETNERPMSRMSAMESLVDDASYFEDLDEDFDMKSTLEASPKKRRARATRQHINNDNNSPSVAPVAAQRPNEPRQTISAAMKLIQQQSVTSYPRVPRKYNKRPPVVKPAILCSSQRASAQKAAEWLADQKNIQQF